MTTIEIKASTMVKEIFPVTLADPGIRPNKLLIKIKKKTVSR
jgi:hypothetical protein